MKLIDLLINLDMDTVVQVVNPPAGENVIYHGLAGGIDVAMAVQCEVLSIDVGLERDSKCGEVFPVMEISVVS